MHVRRQDCVVVRSDLLDTAIGEAALTALRPAELELALGGPEGLEMRDQAMLRQWHMRIERAEYEAALAERRYQEWTPPTAGRLDP